MTKYTSIRERICKLHYNHVTEYKIAIKYKEGTFYVVIGKSHWGADSLLIIMILWNKNTEKPTFIFSSIFLIEEYIISNI